MVPECGACRIVVPSLPLPLTPLFRSPPPCLHSRPPSLPLITSFTSHYTTWLHFSCGHHSSPGFYYCLKSGTMTAASRVCSCSSSPPSSSSSSSRLIGGGRCDCAQWRVIAVCAWCRFRDGCLLSVVLKSFSLCAFIYLSACVSFLSICLPLYIYMIELSTCLWVY